MARGWTSTLLSIVLSFGTMLSSGASRSLKELPNMSINSFAQDSYGYMWIATDNGLCRYNGSTYIQYYNDPSDAGSIPSSKVLSLAMDGNGVLWAATDKGLCWYKQLTDSFVGVATQTLLTGLEAGKDAIYYYGDNGTIRLDPVSKKVVQSEISPSFGFSELKSCPDGNLLALRTDGRQVLKLDPSLSLLKSVILADSSRFNSVDIDWRGDFWVGRDNGLSILDGASLLPKDDSLSLKTVATVGLRKTTIILRNEERMYVCVPGRGVMSFFKSGLSENTTSVTSTWFSLNYTSDFSAGITDRDGVPWVGTKDRGFGVRFYLKKNFSRDPYHKIFVGKFINAASTDGKTVWFGSYYKGLLGYNLSTKKYKWVSYSDEIFTSTPGRVRGITSLLIDSGTTLWIGCPGKILRCATNGHVLKSIELAVEGVDANCFEELPSGEVWAGTDKGLVCCSGPGAGTVLLPDREVTALVKVGDRLLAQLDDLGPHYLDPRTGDLTQVRFPEDLREESLHINTMLPDSKGNLWLGTSFDGVLRAELSEDGSEVVRARAYSLEDGLGSKEIASLVEDGEGNIWITTSYGISLVSDKFDQVVTYYPSPWLDIQQFCQRCIVFVNGFIVAGGNVGVASFQPRDIVNNTLQEKPINLMLTELRVNGIRQKPLQSGGVLEDNLCNTSKLVLKHNQNNLEIEYESISFLLGDKVNFAYRLTGKGRNDRWTEVGSNRYATFSDLPPGRYVFELAVQNQKGMLSDAPLSLDIQVRRSPWLSWYSFLLYLVLAVGFSYCFSSVVIKIKTNKLEVEAVKDELDREKRMAQMKQNFFSNISHELRNSLSLIYGPIKMLKDTSEKEKSDTLIESINLNTKRLLSLTDMTLGLSRIENGTLPLTVTEVPVISLVRNVMASFSPVAVEKDINVGLVSPLDEKTKVVLDADKFVTILSNLVSNALKYTPSRGNVQIRMSLDNTLPEKLSQAKPSSEYILVTVNDDGIGMKREETELIFNRYIRLDDASRSVYGSGIGLHYVKQLLNVHGGAVAASLREEGGMSFSFAIPVDRSLYEVVEDYRDVSLMVDGTEALDLDSYFALEKEDEQSGEEITGPQLPKVVFVEDNLQLLKYCCETFAGKYEVHWASNGLDGYELVGDLLPDIVVTDISMPQMNGYELCSKIKDDPVLSHISVIMLTAKVDEKDKIDGYRAGADIYVTKPFDAVLLMTIMDNVLASKQKMKEYFVAQGPDLQSDETDKLDKLNSADKAFIEKLRGFIDENIADTEININVLASEMNLSRSSFFRKMKSMTGKTPNDFILAYRLNKAADYIKEGSYRINEISDRLGFSSPSHFSKVFKQRFGVSPKAFGLRNDTV